MTGRDYGGSGKGRIRTVVALLLVVVLGYTGFKLVPIRAAAFQLDDEVREQVVFAGSGRRRVSDAEIRRTIVQRAQSLGLPVQERDVEIQRTDSEIRIGVEYTVRVEFPLDFHYDWEFVSAHRGPVF